ncbi:glycerophosphodiester phosphodiesterase family protein [Leucobacter japonicus]|uniref:glycerophosphodiester phosphodiesterase family protein n=1 Tax=Leucobacter japonicus TaxID=1461259 RepID=UPI0006A79FE5|nr:glycerophosphodiester phosphodiesterase family protein [Leucobacter japonicus]
MSTETPGIWAETRSLIAEAVRSVRRAGARLVGLVLATQLVITLVALPVIAWLFREALRASGMHGLDTGAIAWNSGFPLTIALIVVISVLAFWLLSLQFIAIVVVLRWPGESLGMSIRRLGRIARKLGHPRSFSLVLYLFLLLPLSGFGFVSTLTRGIAIPPFISGELAKSPATSIGLSVVLLALALLNLRLSLTVPAFVLTRGGHAARTSWRVTRGVRAVIPLVVSVAAVLVIAAVAASVLAAIAILPTMLTDAIAPDASPAVAAYSLGAAQVAGFVLGGYATATVTAVLIARLRRSASRAPAGVHLIDDDPVHTETGTPGRSTSARRPARVVLVVALVAALGFGTAAIGTMQRLSEYPDTLVLAHRGFSDGGVENTLSGLDAAAKAGADLVEMDVMQTRDGEFIAMHDPKLDRLAGRPEAVKDLTLAELTTVTVRDQQGHTDTIPAFRDYVARAAELQIPLLIEIKLGGADTPDHVDRLVAELEAADALQSNIYHSLDAASVTRLKSLRPDLTVGYTMPFAGGGLPDTSADFIVVEEWTATQHMQDAAWNAGLGFMAWTINDESSMREHLRRDTDGIITDHPDTALDARAGMQQETGLADVLLDALHRFVTVV